MASGSHTLAVKSNKTCRSERGSGTARANHACMPKPFVDALTIRALGHRSQDGSLAPCSSCCLSAASLAKGELGSGCLSRQSEPFAASRNTARAPRAQSHHRDRGEARGVLHVRCARRAGPDVPSVAAAHAGPAAVGGRDDRQSHGGSAGDRAMTELHLLPPLPELLPPRHRWEQQLVVARGADGAADADGVRIAPPAARLRRRPAPRQTYFRVNQFARCPPPARRARSRPQQRIPASDFAASVGAPSVDSCINGARKLRLGQQ